MQNARSLFTCFAGNTNYTVIMIVSVSVPEIKIVDESGHKVVERYYKAGSALELTCIATNIGVPEEEPPMVWKHGERILSNGIRYEKHFYSPLYFHALYH